MLREAKLAISTMSSWATAGLGFEESKQLLAMDVLAARSHEVGSLEYTELFTFCGLQCRGNCHRPPSCSPDFRFEED